MLTSATDAPGEKARAATTGHRGPVLVAGIGRDPSPEAIDAAHAHGARLAASVACVAGGDAIGKVAREARASLIVLDRRDDDAVVRLAAREVAIHAIRHARVPVLVIDPRGDPALRRVVVGMDFSAASIAAARTALELMEPSRPPGAMLSLVHVLPLRAGRTRGAEGDGAGADHERHAVEMFARVLALLAPWTPATVMVETRLVAGEVCEALLDTAIELEADVVAVGTRGAGWLDRVLLGSVAAEVLRGCRRAVLIAPPPTPVERIRLELRVTGHVEFTRAGDWAPALATMTRRNIGRPVRLELSDGGITGVAVHGTGTIFRGAVYDDHDRRVAIILERGDGGHVTHMIPAVRQLSLAATHPRHDLSLEIEHAGGEATLTFLDGRAGP